MTKVPYNKLLRPTVNPLVRPVPSRSKSLSDERQEAYRQIKRMSSEPQDIDIVKPSSWLTATTVREKDGSEAPLPTYDRHLLCDENGAFPADLNGWEIEVLKAEMKREGFLGWYRNPSRASQDSLGVAYSEEEQTKIMRPDFVFFWKNREGEVVAGIVDPHGTQFSDALPKLKGLVRYAEEHRQAFGRIEAVAKVGEKLRVLDLSDSAVCKAVADARDAESLYQSSVASDY